MISTVELQEQIITTLKAHAPIVLVVGEEIREEQWQGKEFTYPCVRVGMVNNIPLGDTCHHSHSTMGFRILCFSESPSSQQCDAMVGLIMEALLGEQFIHIDFTTGEIRLGRQGQIPAKRTPQRVWQSEVHFAINIYGR